MSLRDLFNERRWRTQDLAALTVVIRHRGAPGDERRIAGADILAIEGGGLTVVAVDSEGQPVDDGRAFIPWHRVLRVVAPEAVLYVKEER